MEKDFEKIADFLIEALNISNKIQETSGKKLVDFVAALEGNADVDALGKAVRDFAATFPMPGFDAAELKFKEI